MKNMIGQFVLLERMGSDGKSLDYNSGEYLVIDQSPMTLYCVKPQPDVYALHNNSSFLIEGTNKWNVVKSYSCEETLRSTIATVENQLREDDVDGKRKWVQSVYASARHNLNKLKSFLSPQTKSLDDSTITITIGLRDGKLTIL